MYSFNRCMITLVLLLYVTVSHASGISIVTEEFAPYNYTHPQEGKLTGISTEIVQLVLRESGIEGTVEVLPWARAYARALSDDNVLIYSITRTEQREPLFHWIGSVAPINFYLFKLKALKSISIKTIEDAKKYRIGVVRDTAEHQYLQKAGFTLSKWDISNNHDSNIEKLMNNRVDAIIWDELAFVYKINELGYSMRDFEKILFFEEPSSELYLACSMKTDSGVVEKLTQALQMIKMRGDYTAIVNRYMK